MSSSNCYFLTCIQVSQEAGELVWYSCLFKNFPKFVVIHTVKGFVFNRRLWLLTKLKKMQEAWKCSVGHRTEVRPSKVRGPRGCPRPRAYRHFGIGIIHSVPLRTSSVLSPPWEIFTWVCLVTSHIATLAITYGANFLPSPSSNSVPISEFLFSQGTSGWQLASELIWHLFLQESHYLLEKNSITSDQ